MQLPPPDANCVVRTQWKGVRTAPLRLCICTQARGLRHRVRGDCHTPNPVKSKNTTTESSPRDHCPRSYEERYVPIEIHSEPVRWRRRVPTTIPKLSSSITLSTPNKQSWVLGWPESKKEESSACLIRRSRSLQPDPARIKRGGQYAQTLARSRMSTSTQKGCRQSVVSLAALSLLGVRRKNDSRRFSFLKTRCLVVFVDTLLGQLSSDGLVSIRRCA